MIDITGTFSLILAVAILLSSCQTQEKQRRPDPSTMTQCQRVAALLSNEWATPAQQMVAMEVGRNEGCFGKPQPQRVQIDQTVRVAN